MKLEVGVRPGDIGIIDCISSLIEGFLRFLDIGLGGGDGGGGKRPSTSCACLCSKVFVTLVTEPKAFRGGTSDRDKGSVKGTGSGSVVVPWSLAVVVVVVVGLGCSLRFRKDGRRRIAFLISGSKFSSFSYHSSAVSLMMDASFGAGCACNPQISSIVLFAQSSLLSHPIDFRAMA